MTNKPAGVMILAMLYGLSALLILLAGSIVLLLGGFFILSSSWIAGSIITAIGILCLLIGLIKLVVTYGLWTLKSWARKIAIILTIFGILITFWTIIIPLINILILWYMFQPGVKAAFR